MDDQQLATKALVEEMLRATGLTPSELAQRAGLAASTLTRFLNKPVKHTLSARTLDKLSRISGVAIPAIVAVSPRQSSVPVVGYVGAGERIFSVDEGPCEVVDAPPGSDQETVAVIVRGSSMFPAFWDGDVLYYSRYSTFSREECLYNECIVKLVGGEVYVKRIMPGSAAGRYTLTSYNAPSIIDAEIEWAAPVQFQDKRRRRAKL
ncbi:MAG: helix-turn-helix domain-containing protein [Roseomonas sp.]|nr:helix-turn-helix domain-containing protein [Roseomonas sp.]